MTTAPAPQLRDIQKSVADLQARAHTHIAGLDEQIRAIQQQLTEIERQVPRAAFIQKVIDDARACADDANVRHATAAAKGFGNLRQHVPLTSITGTNATGATQWSASHPHQFGRQIFPYDIPAAALIGLLPELFEPAITAWANRLADELGLPDSGSVEALQVEHESLSIKLKSLDEARTEARTQLAQLVEVCITPYADDDHLKRITGQLPPMFEPFPEADQRPAGVYDENGQIKAAIGSDGWRQFWARRHAEEAAEEAAEAAAEHALTGTNG
ncbi:MAG TPA: hypothetical protein PLN31_12625 [Azoarcus taiwanensis]|nr:hypothetical protein [Azoarcus taiwanensis]